MTTTSSSTHSTTSVGQENLLKRLIKAYNEDNLTLFIGAGISKCVVDSKAMLWSEAVEEMNNKLGLHESDPLRLAQLFYQQLPEEYNEFVHSMIDSSAKPSPVHMLIAQLHPKVIITTNWDCLIEQAIVSSYMFYDTIRCDEELLFSKSPYKIIKMHGDFARNDERFVFKEDDYLNYSKNYPLIETFLKNILITSNVLFLGYSYSDINLKLIMTWLKQNKKSANLPLYVMTEFTENRSQIKYLQNWGMETYICENISEKSKTLYLPVDEKNMSQKTYTLLECIYLGISNFNDILCSLLNRIEPYKNLSAIPFSLITSLIKGSNIKCDEYGNPILNIQYTPDEVFTSRLISQIKNDSNSINIIKLKDFFLKAGIVNISDNHFSNTSIPTNLLFEKKDNTQPYLDDVKDINDYLSFKTISFDRHYDIVYHNRLIQESLKSGNISTAFIELFNLNIHKLFSLQDNKHNDFPKFTIDDVFNKLPDNLKVIYKALISSIKFEDIKNKTKRLYELIEKKKKQIENKIKGTISFDNTDSFISRSEHLNFLRFVWLNHLCVDYYTEVKDFVYHSIILLNHILIYHEIPLLLKRFELSSILHFLDKNQIIHILSGETYSSSNTALQINIEEEDIMWLIEEVSPNLVELYNSKDKNQLIDNNWTTRIGYIFIILNHIQQISENSIKNIYHFIISNINVILKDQYNLLDPIVNFFKNQYKKIKSCSETSSFLLEIKQILINYINQSDTNQQKYGDICNNLLDILVLFKDGNEISIDNFNFIDTYITNYVELDWKDKYQFFSSINKILLLTPQSIKDSQIQKLKDSTKTEKNPPIGYYIFKSYLILVKILNPSKEFFKEIRESQSFLSGLECSYNGEIELLYSILKGILDNQELHIQLSDELNTTLKSFVYKQSPSPFFPPIIR